LINTPPKIWATAEEGTAMKPGIINIILHQKTLQNYWATAEEGTAMKPGIINIILHQKTLQN